MNDSFLVESGNIHQDTVLLPKKQGNKTLKIRAYEWLSS